MTHLDSILRDRKDTAQTAVVSGSDRKEYAFRDLAFLASEVTEQLRKAGVEPSDRIGILLPPSVEFVSSFFGIMGADAVAAPIDYTLKTAMLQEVLEILSPAGVVTSTDIAPRIRRACRHLPFFATIDVKESRKLSWTVDRRDPASAKEAVPVAPRRPPESDAIILFTSGSTGSPKGVRLSHKGSLFNMDRHLESLRIGEEGLVYTQLLPAHFSYGLIASLLGTLYAKGTLFLPAAISGTSWLDADLRPDVVLGTPTIYHHLSGTEQMEAPYVRTVTVGGEPYTGEDAALIRRCFPNADCFATYGLTEAGPRVATLPPEHFLEQFGRIGIPLRDVQIRIDAKSSTAAAEGTGELLVNSPSLMNGYLESFEGSHESPIEDGWLHTGDLGGCRDGLYFITGRKDRQIKWRGRRLNPATIERVLQSHPDVAHVQVLLTNSNGTRELQARVSPAANRDLEPKDLRRWCGRSLSFFMIPDRFTILDPNEDRPGHFKRKITR